MRKHIITVLLIICIPYIGLAQYSKKSKHPIRPVVSASYQPTWILDDYHGNTKATVFMAGIHGFKEMGKESYFSLGLMYGTFKDVEDEQYTGWILPIQLHKFFNADRKGFNLDFGLWINYCASCSETAGASVSQGINYMFGGHPVRVNVGLLTMLGNLYTDPSIQVGPQVQLMWVPEPKSKK
jgi:hypothetical protein